MKHWSDEAFAGYLAAMIDGEGNVELIGDYSVRIRIANTIKHTLEAIVDRMECGRVIEYARPPDKGYKRLFCAEFSSCTDVDRVWQICNPYIHMKRDQMAAPQEIIRRAFKRVDQRDSRNREILKMISDGIVQKQIARHFGVSEQLVSRIKRGHTWPSVIESREKRQLDKVFPAGDDQSFRLHGAPCA